MSGAEATVLNIENAVTAARGRLGAGDAFVFYFVGHGEVVRDGATIKNGWSAGDREPGLADLFVLITQDILVAGAAEAGIPGAVLIEWLAPIAEVTGNVTVVLDCCHAAGGVPGRVGERGARLDAAIGRARARLRERYAVHRSGREVVVGERQLVCVVATTRNEFAQEGRSLDGAGEVGLLSDALAESLMEPAADAWTWDEHIVNIQRLVLPRCSTQRPGVEGPRYRRPFTREVCEPDGSYPCGVDERGVFCVRAGVLHGVEVGDEFVVVRADEPSRVLVETRVRDVDVDRAALTGEVQGAGLRAMPVRRSSPVALGLRGEAGATALVRAGAPARLGVVFEARGEDVLEVEAGRATLWDRRGEALRVDAGVGDGAALLRVLEAVGRVAHLRRIERGFAGLDRAKAPTFELVWGCGARRFAGGERVTQDDAVWVALEPRSHGELHVSAFHVRGDASIVDMTADLDHGRTITRGQVTELLQTAGGERQAWPLRRGPGIWDGRDVREAIVLIVSPRPISLHRLATPGRVFRSRENAMMRSPPPVVVRLELVLVGA